MEKLATATQAQSASACRVAYSGTVHNFNSFASRSSDDRSYKSHEVWWAFYQHTRVVQVSR